MILTAHLFDGYVKRGANDNMSGCVIELEILRTLNHLIATGQLPRPRRTIHFLWPQEISGTYAFLKEHPGFTDPLSVNLNLDMVGEGLRHSNAAVRMYQCPGHLPSYVDGLAKSLLNYVWRTNDVILRRRWPARPAGRAVFPDPPGREERIAGRVSLFHSPERGRHGSCLFHQPVGGRAGHLLDHLA